MLVARNPGPGSRGTTTTTSPLHPRFSGSNLESPTGKQEDEKGECHRLPLPPGSPTSPSTLPTTRTCMVIESTQSNFSRWRKGRLLARGTFGHVYLGFNSEGGRMCAIKEVRVITDDKTSKECLKQLNQEITLLSQLSHPNIVQYYGSELGEETLSVYLEYVSGGSIHKLLQEYGPFKEPVIQNYTRQILSGLAYLHGQNTVHRDIKGANILVDPNGEIKLADFGMAKHITVCSSMLSFKGSPYWMAPEVMMNTNSYSLPVDIWSLGCTILEMASGKPPWSQFEGAAAIFKIVNGKDFPEIPDHLSNDAKSFLRMCLRRDPSGRPTALQLLDHPFVREQGTPRHSTSNLTKEVSPYLSDGSHTPLDSSQEKPLVNFDTPNIKAHGLLVSNSARRCTAESVCSFVDSMTSISSTDFDALDNRSHLGRAYHNGPIVFNSEKSTREEKNTRAASARRCTTESVCSFVDSMTSISSTDFDALDNRSHLGRAYHSGPIVFNSEKKDTREGLSGECLTKSAISFDDSTKRKSLPFDVNLSSFSGHASQDFDDLSSLSDNASQDFDDFDFVGFDYGAGMLPNLKDERINIQERHQQDGA